VCVCVSNIITYRCSVRRTIPFYRNEVRFELPV